MKKFNRVFVAGSEVNIDELKRAVECGAIRAEDEDAGVTFTEFGTGDWDDGYVVTLFNGEKAEYDMDLWANIALENLRGLEDLDLKEYWESRIFQ